jgi:hypothetical protein
MLLLLQKMDIADERNTANVLAVCAIGQWDALIVGEVSCNDC